jgi:hypothetical protein
MLLENLNKNGRYIFLHQQQNERNYLHQVRKIDDTFEIMKGIRISNQNPLEFIKNENGLRIDCKIKKKPKSIFHFSGFTSILREIM